MFSGRPWNRETFISTWRHVRGSLPGVLLRLHRPVYLLRRLQGVVQLSHPYSGRFPRAPQLHTLDTSGAVQSPPHRFPLFPWVLCAHIFWSSSTEELGQSGRGGLRSYAVLPKVLHF